MTMNLCGLPWLACRGVRGVPDGREPDHGVRLLQRRRGAQLNGVPGHGGRRGRAQQVADPRAGPARGVQPGGPRRRRRHPPALRLHLLQVCYYVDYCYLCSQRSMTAVSFHLNLSFFLKRKNWYGKRCFVL